MIELFFVSFRAFLRIFPDRAYIGSVSWQTIVSVWAVLSVLSVLSYIRPEDSMDPAALKWFVTWNSVIFVIVGIGLTFVSQWILNRYASNTFSIREVFAIQCVFTSFLSLLYVPLDLLEIYTGGSLSLFTGFVALSLAFYSLLTCQKGLASVAKITSNQAAVVILGPFLLLLVGYFVAILTFAAIASFIAGL